MQTLFLAAGRGMLALAYGWEKSSKFSPYATVGMTAYFLLWMLSFIGFGTGDEILAYILSIGMPILYAVFVIVVRSKNKKQLLNDDTEENEPIEDDQPESDEQIRINDYVTTQNTEPEEEARSVSKGKIRLSPYIIAIAVFILCLAGMAGYSIININNKTEKISKLEKISIEYQSEKSEMSAKIDSLENQPDIYNDSIVRFANSQYGNQVSDKFYVKQTVVMKLDDAPITIKMKYSGTDKINISNHDKIIRYSMSETSIHGTYDITISPLDKGSTILTLTERLGKVIDPEYYNILVIVI